MLRAAIVKNAEGKQHARRRHAAAGRRSTPADAMRQRAAVSDQLPKTREAMPFADDRRADGGAAKRCRKGRAA